MSDLQGAQLVRSLYSDFYGGSLANLWPLKSKLNQREREKCLRHSSKRAQAEDAAERNTAMAMKRNVIPTHWAWGPNGYLRARSKMMRSVNYKNQNVVLWECSTGADVESFPLMMMRPLVICSVNEVNGEDYFHQYSIQLDMQEAVQHVRYIASCVGTFQCSADSCRFEIASGDGIVTKNGYPLTDRLEVFVHNSGSLAVKLGHWYTFTPIHHDITRIDSVIEWHNTAGEHKMWTRRAAVLSSPVVDTSKFAEASAQQQLLLEGQQLKNIYLVCRSFEATLRRLIQSVDTTLGAITRCAVSSAVHILQYLRPRYLRVHQARKNAPLSELALVPIGSTIIKHNGVEGLASEFVGTHSVSDDTTYMPSASANPEKKPKLNNDRYRFKEKWLEEFPWLRIGRSPTNTDLDFIYCFTCKHYSKAWRKRDKISKGIQLLSRLRQDYLVVHSKTEGHVVSTKEATASVMLASPNTTTNNKTVFESRQQEILALWKECLSDVSDSGSQSSTLALGQLADGSKKPLHERTKMTVADAQSLLVKMQAGLNEAAREVRTSSHEAQLPGTEVSSTTIGDGEGVPNSSSPKERKASSSLLPQSSSSSSSSSFLSSSASSSPSSSHLLSSSSSASSSSSSSLSSSSVAIPKEASASSTLSPTTAREHVNFTPLLQAIEMTATPGVPPVSKGVTRNLWL
jgi:hypothetical protein